MDVGELQWTREFARFARILILFENSSRLVIFLVSNGTMFHTFPSKYSRRDFKPHATNSIYILQCAKNLSVGKFILKLRFSNNSDIIGIKILFFSFYISISNEGIFLSCRDTERTLSYKWFIRLFETLPQNIRVSRQCLNCGSIKAFIKVLGRSWDMNLQSFVRALYFLPVFLYRFNIYLSKCRLLSTIIPSGFFFYISRF